MVEYAERLDMVFDSLGDATRRDILKRVARHELSISEIAACYDMTFAAVAKHLTVLQDASLITKRKEGRKQMVSLAPYTFKSIDLYLEQYRRTWQSRFNKLDKLIGGTKSGRSKSRQGSEE